MDRHGERSAQGLDRGGHTDFIGKIVVRYTFEPVESGTKYTRTLRNPDRPSEPGPEQVARMDEEA